MMQVTDATGWQASFDQGDVTVLDDIIEWYFPILYRRARRRYGLSHEDAEDVVQTVFGAFTKLIEAGHSNFALWLYVVTDNECLKHLKSKHRRTVSLDAPPSGDPDGDSLGSQIRDRAKSAPEQLEGTELRQFVVDCVDDLTEDERTVVWLRVRDGVSFQQIADMLGRPLGTVSSWFQRALPKLRDCILRKLDKQEANWPDLRRELGLGNSG